MLQPPDHDYGSVSLSAFPGYSSSGLRFSGFWKSREFETSTAACLGSSFPYCRVEQVA